VIVLGAGLSGLATAFRLQQSRPDADILVLEPRSRPGGTIYTERAESFMVEHGPNGFLDSNPATIELCRDIGLAGALVAAAPAAGKNRYLFLDGALKRLPGSLLDFLRTDLLSWRGKLAFVRERFRRSVPPASDESIDAFTRRRAGAEAAEVFADALVTGIHAGDPTLLSIRAAFPRIAAFEAEYGSVLKGMAAAARARRAASRQLDQPRPSPPRMWSLPGGLGALIERLVANLRQPPRYRTAATRIEALPARKWRITIGETSHVQADAVVLACPAPDQSALLTNLDPGLAQRIGSIAYNRVAVVALGYCQNDVPRPLAGFGYIAPQRTRRDVLGVQWCSSIFGGRAPAGTVLLRAMCGGWNRPDIVGWDDDRLLTATRNELQLAMGIRATPIFQRIVRWDRAIPQYHLGHLDRVGWIEERSSRHPGLFLTGNAYRGVAMNDCTSQAAIVARKVNCYLNELAASS
jgi:protoporphyrinogen/coproporphyrinogen III oxidase